MAGLRRTLGSIVIGGVAWFVAAIVILHLLRPDVDALARVTSEYAVGPYGTLMMGAYLGFAAIQLFLLERGLGGAAQRVVLLFVAAWMVASARRLR